MTPAAWRYAFASVAGTSHARQQIGCQDAGDCRVAWTWAGEPVLVAVASDGAGSARRAETGSRLACALLLEDIVTLFEGGGTVADVTREFARGWVARFQGEIGLQAEAAALTPRDFACTALAAVVAQECAAFLQIGDGAIVAAWGKEGTDYDWVFWPHKGEYENVTFFATDAAAGERLEHVYVEARVDEVALFTDGIQRLALHFGSRTAHAPFFRPMFAPVRGAAVGYSAPLSAGLAAYLDLPQVNDRTDDDKTLILATRRAAAPADR